MVDLNSTIIIQMIGFLILLFTLNIILYKPILRTLSQRREAVESLIRNADDIKQEALKKEEDYSIQLNQAEKEAKERYNNIVASAVKEKEELITKETQEARQLVEKQKQEVFELLDKEIENTKQYGLELSNKIYEQLVG